MEIIKDPQQDTIPKETDRSKLKAGTLNFCGILSSPFEFHSKDWQQELSKISHLFR
jgi:hypothetical protein